MIHKKGFFLLLGFFRDNEDSTVTFIRKHFKLNYDFNILDEFLVYFGFLILTIYLTPIKHVYLTEITANIFISFWTALIYLFIIEFKKKKQ